MTIQELGQVDEPGPIDYLVVEFPREKQAFSGEMARELRRLADSGTVRVLRVLIATKNPDGSTEINDMDSLTELTESGGALGMARDVAGLMAFDDLAQVTERMGPGAVAAVVVWENTWAAGFVAAARRAGGARVSSGRIPADAISGDAG